VRKIQVRGEDQRFRILFPNTRLEIARDVEVKRAAAMRALGPDFNRKIRAP